MRRKMKNRSKDRRIFRQTADKTQSVNVTPKNMRGGIRL